MQVIEETQLSILAAQWRQAKRDEEEAKQRRLKVEESIVAAMPHKDEGTVTERTDDGVKVTVTHSLTRSVDTEALRSNWHKLSAPAQAAFKFKAEVSMTVLRSLMGETSREALMFISAKPAKPSVKVESL